MRSVKDSNFAAFDRCLCDKCCAARPERLELRPKRRDGLRYSMAAYNQQRADRLVTK